MLKISPESFAAVSRPGEDAYVARLSALLRDTVPDLASEPAARLDAQVWLQVEAARSFGLISEQAIAAFVMTAAQLGPDFPDRFPAARAILTDAGTDAEKADALERFTLALFDALER